MTRKQAFREWRMERNETRRVRWAIARITGRPMGLVRVVKKRMAA